MNSAHYRNIDSREAYRAANLWDEIAGLFPLDWPHDSVVPKDENSRVLISRQYTGADQIHHIAKGLGGADRDDAVTNLIALSFWTHSFCERWKSDGLVLCVAAKLRKGEWDDDEMRRITGVNVRAYLLTRRLRWPFAVDLLDTIRERGAA